MNGSGRRRREPGVAVDALGRLVASVQLLTKDAADRPVRRLALVALLCWHSSNIDMNVRKHTLGPQERVKGLF